METRRPSVVKWTIVHNVRSMRLDIRKGGGDLGGRIEMEQERRSMQCSRVTLSDRGLYGAHGRRLKTTDE